MEWSLPKLTFSKDLTRLAVSDDFGGVVKAMTNVDQNDLINVNHHHLRNFLLHHLTFARSDQDVLTLHTLRWA
jgi:hypothetical protein